MSDEADAILKLIGMIAGAGREAGVVLDDHAFELWVCLTRYLAADQGPIKGWTVEQLGNAMQIHVARGTVKGQA
jgi:hypothetical protein